jgi:hypothetical protein
MTEHDMTPAAVTRRIAGARSVGTPVDSQGRPTGQPARFDYDERGILIAAKPAPTEAQPVAAKWAPVHE